MTYDDATGYSEEMGEVSTSLLALWHDEGRICAECQTTFVEAHGKRVACAFCKRRGSEYPLASHSEVNKEAHRAEARARKNRRTK